MNVINRQSLKYETTPFVSVPTFQLRVDDVAAGFRHTRGAHNSQLVMAIALLLMIVFIVFDGDFADNATSRLL